MKTTREYIDNKLAKEEYFVVKGSIGRIQDISLLREFAITLVEIIEENEFILLAKEKALYKMHLPSEITETKKEIELEMGELMNRAFKLGVKL